MFEPSFDTAKRIVDLLGAEEKPQQGRAEERNVGNLLKKLKKETPEYFRLQPKEQSQWHRRQLRAARREKQDWAIEFHGHRLKSLPGRKDGLSTAQASQ